MPSAGSPAWLAQLRFVAHADETQSPDALRVRHRPKGDRLPLREQLAPVRRVALHGFALRRRHVARECRPRSEQPAKVMAHRMYSSCSTMQPGAKRRTYSTMRANCAEMASCPTPGTP